MINLLSFFLNKVGIEYDHFQKTYIYVLWISLIYFAPFIIYQVIFNDDFERKVNGLQYAHALGRPFAGWILSFFNQRILTNLDAHPTFIDTGALLQIVSIVVLALASTIFCLYIYKSSSEFYSALLAFAIIGNPFFLQSFSYQFDSIGLTMSLVFALFASIRLSNKFIDVILGTSLLIIALGTYQSSFNVFIGATLLIFLVRFSKDRLGSSYFLISNFFKLLFGTLIYKFFILKNLEHTLSSFYLRFSELTPYDQNWSKSVWNTFNQISERIIDSFNDSLVFNIFIVLSISIYFFHYGQKWNTGKQLLFFLDKFIYCISTSGIILSIVGFLTFVKEPSLESRVYSSFSILLAFSFFAFLNCAKEEYKFSLVIIVFFLIVNSYAYHAVIRSQRDFLYATGIEIKSKLEKLGITKDNPIYFNGYLDYSNSSENNLKRNSITKSVTNYNLGGNWFSSVFFNNLGLEADYNRYIYTAELESELAELCKNTALFSTPLYKIFKSGDTFLVAFRGNGNKFGLDAKYRLSSQLRLDFKSGNLIKHEIGYCYELNRQNEILYGKNE